MLFWAFSTIYKTICKLLKKKKNQCENEQRTCDYKEKSLGLNCARLKRRSKGRKEGRKEGRKQGRKEERKEGRKEGEEDDDDDDDLTPKITVQAADSLTSSVETAGVSASALTNGLSSAEKPAPFVSRRSTLAGASWE